MALSYNLFFIPNRIAPGGFTGLATIFSVLWGWPVGLTAACLNIPLFLVGWKRLGTRFAVRSLAAMLLLSLLLDLIPVKQISGDLLLCSAMGGVLLGVGLALVLMDNASTGGTDLASSILHAAFPHVAFGWLLLCIESVIVLISAFALGTAVTLYAVVALVISSRLVDMLQAGLQEDRLFFVITQDPEPLKKAIVEKLDRSATLLEARGAYLGERRDVLLCVVSRNQVLPLRQIVYECDPRAFAVLTKASETMGEGFRHILPTVGNAPETQRRK